MSPSFYWLWGRIETVVLHVNWHSYREQFFITEPYDFFSTRQHIAYILSALLSPVRPSVRPSVTRVDKSKRLKLGL